MIRAVTEPYPGAFTLLPGGEKLLIWWAYPEHESASNVAEGTVEIEKSGVYVKASDGRLRLIDIERGKKRMKGYRILEYFKNQGGYGFEMKILILGVNGFIGHHLTHRILETTDWTVYGMDLAFDRLDKVSCIIPASISWRGIFPLTRNGSSITSRNVTSSFLWLPLPRRSFTMEDPIAVFNLDFEMNLNVVRQCVKYRKRIVFPSTSEVYGASTDPEFKEDETFLVLGPIQKERWIYACCKQLLDRVIYAYGTRGTWNLPFLDPSTGSGRGWTLWIPPRKEAPEWSPSSLQIC